VHDAVLDRIRVHLDLAAIEQRMIEPTEVGLAVGGAGGSD
jgi:hypothetical protein